MGYIERRGGVTRAPRDFVGALHDDVWPDGIIFIFSEIFLARYRREAGMPAVTGGVFRSINGIYNPRHRHSYFGNISHLIFNQTKFIAQKAAHILR